MRQVQSQIYGSLGRVRGVMRLYISDIYLITFCNGPGQHT